MSSKRRDPNRPILTFPLVLPAESKQGMTPLTLAGKLNAIKLVWTEAMKDESFGGIVQVKAVQRACATDGKWFKVCKKQVTLISGLFLERSTVKASVLEVNQQEISEN